MKKTVLLPAARGMTESAEDSDRLPSRAPKPRILLAAGLFALQPRPPCWSNPRRTPANLSYTVELPTTTTRPTPTRSS